MESSFLTRDQALSLESGSTDPKTLDFQRTNPREYQIVRTHTKETTWILTSPNHQLHPVQDSSSKQQTKQKYKPNHQQAGLPPLSALPIRGKSESEVTQSLRATPWKTNKQKLSTNLTLCEAYQATGPTLAGQKQKGKKNSTLKPGKRRPQT